MRDPVLDSDDAAEVHRRVGRFLAECAYLEKPDGDAALPAFLGAVQANVTQFVVQMDGTVDDLVAAQQLIADELRSEYRTLVQRGGARAGRA